jgi:hypothetical protein
MTDKQKFNLRSVLSILVIVTLAIFAIATVDTTPNKGSSDDLTVIEAHFKHGQYGTRSIAGTVKNNGSKTYGYVQVSINLYDSSGSQVGSTLANVNNLEPGKSWAFDAPILEENATKFQVMDVTGF